MQHLPPLGRSDHQCLLIHPKVGTKMKSPPRGECVRFKTKLGELVPAVFSAHDVDEKVNLFPAILLGILDDTLPESTVHVHPTDKS